MWFARRVSLHDGFHELTDLDRRQLDYFAVVFTALIGVVSFAAMSLSVGGQIGFILLCIPAALEMLAGIWLGPVRGMLAAVVGAYVAAAFAYGGWGLVAIANPIVAGGAVNAILPPLVFQLVRIDVHAGMKIGVHRDTRMISLVLLIALVCLSLSPVFVEMHSVNYTLLALALVTVICIGLAHVVGKRMLLILVSLVAVSALESSLVGSSFYNFNHQRLGATALLNIGIPWLLWSTAFVAFGLYFLYSYRSATDRPQLVRWFTTGFLCVVLALSTLVSFRQYFSINDVRLVTDSRDYISIGSFGPVSEQFWTCTEYEIWTGSQYERQSFSRPPVYPLFIWSLGHKLHEEASLLQKTRWTAYTYASRRNFDSVALAQFLIGLGCWSLLTVAVFASTGNRIVGLIGAMVVLMFSQLPEIAGVYRVVMTESLSFSLFVGMCGAAIFFIKSHNGKWIVLAAVLASLYALLRDAEAYLTFFLSILVLLIALGFAIRRKTNRRIAIVSIAASVMMIASFFVSNTTADLSQRWLFNFYDDLWVRVLPSHQRTEWFEAHGMPDDPVLTKLAQHETGERESAYYLNVMLSQDSTNLADPRLSTFKRWAEVQGKETYEGFLLTHPRYSLLEPLGDLPWLLSDDVWRLSPRGYRPMIMGPYNFGVVELLILNLSCVLMVFISNHSGSVETNGIVAFSAALIVLTIPHFLVVWHGDAADIGRHLSQVAIQFKVGVLLLFVFSLDTVAAFVSHFMARLRSKIGVRRSVGRLSVK